MEFFVILQMIQLTMIKNNMIAYGMRIIVILISFFSFLFLYFYLKKKKSNLSNVKVFFIILIQLLFSSPAIYIRVKQYFFFNEYIPKENEMWIICFSYCLAGISYPLIYAWISLLNNDTVNEELEFLETSGKDNNNYNDIYF